MSHPSNKGFIVFVSFWFKVLVVTAKTFVFTGTFWANGNFDLPGLPSDTDNVIINQRLCIINNHVNAVCKDLFLTEDHLVLQKNSILTVHGETTIAASLIKAGIDVSENAKASFLGQVNLNSQYYDDYAVLTALQKNSILEFHQNVVVYPHGSIKGEVGSFITLKGKDNKVFPFSKMNFAHLVIDADGTRRLDQSIKPGNNLGEYNGSITIQKGTLGTGNYSITGNPSGFIRIKSGGNLTIAGNLGFPLGFGDIYLDRFSTVTYGKIGNQDIDSLNFWNLSITGFGSKSCTGKTTVNGILSIGFGKLITNNQLTLLSNNQGTATVSTLCTSCNIEGNLKMQRMIPHENASLLAGGWLKGNSFVTWADSLNEKGISGGNFPTSPIKTFQYFSEDSLNNGKGGFFTLPNLSDSIWLGKGVVVNTDTNKALTFLLDGEIFKGDTTFHFGSSTHPKMNFIANPYPSALLFFFEGYDKRGCYNPFTIDQYGNYVPIQGGDTLHVGEGFFLLSKGSNPYLKFSEIFKVGSPGKTRFGNGKNLNNGLGNSDLVFELFRPDGSKDYSKIIFITEETSVGFDTLIDGLKIPNLYGKANIATVAEGQNFGLNFLPKYQTQNLAIPLKVWQESTTTDSANYGIAIKNINRLQQQNLCIQLIDKELNIKSPIFKDTLISFSKIKSDTTIRFILEISNPITLEATNVLCKLDSNGSAAATLNIPNQTFFWKILNDTVKYSPAIGFSDVVENLYPGEYKVTVLNHPSCGTIAETFEITEPDSLLIAKFTPNRTTAKLNKGAEFIFTNQSSGGKNYLWTFGDGDTLANSFNASHIYSNPGNFIVQLHAYRDQCTKIDSAFIEVIDDTYINEVNGNTDIYIQWVQKNTLQITSKTAFIGEWQLYNLQGRIIETAQIDVEASAPIQIYLQQTDGVYIFSVKNLTKNTIISKKVFISR